MAGRSSTTGVEPEAVEAEADKDAGSVCRVSGPRSWPADGTWLCAGSPSAPTAPTGRRKPSRSALRRTRSACWSSMLEEWLLTPIPSDMHRSRASLLVRPSSRPSSYTRIFLAKLVGQSLLEISCDPRLGSLRNFRLRETSVNASGSSIHSRTSWGACVRSDSTDVSRLMASAGT